MGLFKKENIFSFVGENCEYLAKEKRTELLNEGISPERIFVELVKELNGGQKCEVLVF